MIATGSVTQTQNNHQIAHDNDYPNPVTVAAIKEVEEMMKHPDDFKTYTDVHQMFKELLA